jgi:hypothetical protein
MHPGECTRTRDGRAGRYSSKTVSVCIGRGDEGKGEIGRESGLGLSNNTGKISSVASVDGASQDAKRPKLHTPFRPLTSLLINEAI